MVYLNEYNKIEVWLLERTKQLRQSSNSTKQIKSQHKFKTFLGKENIFYKLLSMVENDVVTFQKTRI